jgi:hypothetical protein
MAFLVPYLMEKRQEDEVYYLPYISEVNARS